MNTIDVIGSDDPIRAAINEAEEVRDPLEDLAERTRADPGAAFAPEVLERLAAHEEVVMPAADDKKATTVVVNDPDDLKGTLKRIGGSQSDRWNNIVANQAVQSLWLKNSDEDTRARQYSAAVAGLAGVG